MCAAPRGLSKAGLSKFKRAMVSVSIALWVRVAISEIPADRSICVRARGVLSVIGDASGDLVICKFVNGELSTIGDASGDLDETEAFICRSRL